MNFLVLVYQLIILGFSIMIHEISHAAVANALGDSTAKDAGRLTLNPTKHFELWGSFLLPLLLYIASSGSFVFGWAKPVPFNPYNLKNPKRDSGLIGLAGPFSNFLMAIIFGVATRLIVNFQVVSLSNLLPFFSLIIFVNLIQGVFNLVPIPPLDGSKILFALLPRGSENAMMFLERYGLFIFLVFILFGFQYLYPIINFLYKIIVGA